MYDGATVMPEDYKWREIENLPQDVLSLTNNELRPLHRIWLEQKDSLADQRIIEEFNLQMKREWAIETGSIEGVYQIDRGITQTLIEHGINASLIPHQASGKSREYVATIIQDHAEVLDWLFDFVKGQRELTTSYVKELHAALLRHEDKFVVKDQHGELREKDLQKGLYKVMPNSPTREDGSLHEYCPPEHVASEMDRLIAWHQEHLRRDVPPEVASAWLHHRFTQIHPFEDGNGRVARAIASLVFIKAGWFPLVIRTDEKVKYIEALERADSGDLGPLVAQFTEGQKRVFLTALDLAYRIKLPATIDAAVASTRDLFVGMGTIVPKEWMRAREIAHKLFNRTVTRLNYAAEKLRAEITSVRPTFRFDVRPNVQRDNEVAQIGGNLHYTANLAIHNQMAELLFTTSQYAAIVVSFHGIGGMYRGILAVSALLATGDKPVAVCDEFFQINYEEEETQAEARFDTWLEKSIVRGLTLWQRTVLGETR